MAAQFPRPVLFAGYQFADIAASDPASVIRAAHETARALVARARADDDPDVLERLVHYTDEHGIDAIAELWARSGAATLPGALWRIYLVRVLIRQDPAGAAFVFQRGSEVLSTIDSLVAGAPSPTGPDDIVELADQILRGVFVGDLALALERAAAFCRISAAGASHLADDQDAAHPERASEFTRRALRLTLTAEELTACARLARADALE